MLIFHQFISPPKPTTQLPTPIPPITHKLLTQQLPHLQNHPIINPILYYHIPPK
ncbi:winged helix-turn-helix transcriptional regulator, partial [Paenibacillus xylanexedens]|uniref:winged helix-turn-helix transcriptional regulator n=1 Tax=Paenibacillus xylanexedens TaxID=528191 RepID=UPI0034D957F8